MHIERIPTPAYVLDEEKLVKNLEILKGVQDRTGCKILLAQKAFSMFCEYPLIGKYLSGTTASGLYEARLGHEEMGKENHIFSPAYRESEIDEIADICDHVIFNSFSQLRRFGPRCQGRTSIGLRINPECSTQGNASGDVSQASGAASQASSLPDVSGTASQASSLPDVSGAAFQTPFPPDANGTGTGAEHPAIYDPCAPGSRLGITQEIFERELSGQAALIRKSGTDEQTHGGNALRDPAAVRKDSVNSGGGFAGDRKDCADGCKADILACVDGLHFHTLCEQNSDDLETTLSAVERRFGSYLKQMKWLNMGGGHHITRADYDLERLERCIRHMQETYDLQVYLEPGEAVALNAGYLVTEVMDIVENGGIKTLILDASAACHMPDVLEMPYRPPLFGSGQPQEKPYTYRLSSCTCLAGDIIGDYSFDREIHPGDRLYFEDMAIYSMVKNNTFNGIALPSIWVMEAAGEAARQSAGTSDGISQAAKAPRGECHLVKKFGYEDFKGRLS
ncbi:MAG: carboxynorspermidine decarboxylase [Lachnospiraceae bacterium]|nr:carboxynorspermidine decarboxylase [Lachnospiraceae bacterium]